MAGASALPAQAPAFVAPLEVPVSLGGRELVVRAATVGQIARMMGAGAPLVRALLDLSPALVQRLGEEPGPGDIVELLELLSREPQRLLELVAIAAGLPVGEVEALAPDAFAYLFAVVVQVNADFFSRATPAFAAAGAVLRAASTRATASPKTPGPAPSTP